MNTASPNHLIHETSPYLLQHAYNPVEWFPWGDAAFEKAKKEDKPILVSIGYAACHWCHVMEHESFENEVTAKFMNTWFVNIKVDREERPDIDNIYMSACQILTGAGGWPLNIFLTPDLIPFSGGTYFPPKPGYGKPSWMEVLMYMKDVFSRERDKVEEQAATLSDHILKMDNAFVGEGLEIPEGENLFSKEDVVSIVRGLKNNFDNVEGGFGNAPKFPSTMNLLFLLRVNFFNSNIEIEDHIHLSLKKMMLGGIFDHAGGGFARYTVDRKWMVPHFEKMLYDNALLVLLYAEAFMATKNDDYRNVVIKTLKFLEDELMHADFGFYSSYDADSEGVEGKFYTFTKNEINQIFGNESDLVCKIYTITEEGNWEHTNILFRTKTDDAIAEELNISKNEFKLKLDQINQQLFNYRQKRVKPGLDDKIILSWNALTCSAFVQAFKATGIEHYREMAIKNMDFLIRAFGNKKQKGELFHTYKNGASKHPAFIEDYGAVIQALLDVYEISGNEKYLTEALDQNKFVLENFSDNNGLFYFTKKDQEDIPMRNKDFYDNATPSGNSLMVNNLLRLSVYTGNQEFTYHAFKMIALLKKAVLQYSASFGNLACAILKTVYPVAEVAILGAGAAGVKDMLIKHYYPHMVLQTDTTGNSDAPLLKNRFPEEGTFIYLCRNNTCNLPVSSLQDFIEALEEF
ncbi:MAG: thioredoxin domain-containing protein [Chitinophagales bacterium]